MLGKFPHNFRIAFLAAFGLIIPQIQSQVVPGAGGSGAPTSVIVGQVQSATGSAINYGALTFSLSQPAVVAGSASIATEQSACYTSAQGNIVGIPDTVITPVLSVNLSSGTLPAGTYYVVLYYIGAGGVGAVSPEASINLSSQGTLYVRAPGVQPNSASGFGVAIATTSGAETIQNSVTGWAQYAQNVPLVTGATPHALNTSFCSVYLSDQLIPTGTYYTVNLVNKNGSQISGYPQSWCMYGGAGATINVSNGAPTGNCSTSGVFYPTPIFANPPNTLVQSIAGGLNLGGGLSISGNLIGILNVTAQSFFTGLTFLNGTTSVTKLNHTVYVDGVIYSLSSAGIQAAIAAACNGTIPGRVILSPTGAGQFVTGLTGQITGVSNCTISGPGGQRLILQVAGSYSASPFLLISGVSHFRLEGVGLDATGNTNSLDAIDANNSSDVVLSDVLVSNWPAGNGIVFNNTNYSALQDSEITRIGPALPSLGASVLLQSGSSHNKLLRNKIHDGNIGVLIYNATAITEDNVIAENQVYSNANDGTLSQASSPLGGMIRGTRLENNEISCNGWPASGSGFSSDCTPGYRQTGGTSSSSGVGIDMIGPLIQQPVIVGNKLHDNFFDGVSLGTQMFATETVSGANVTCTTCGVSAPNFNLGWQPNEFVSIGGTACQISSVGSATSLTLTTSCGSNGQFIGPTYVGATVTGNNSWNNGNVLSGGTGYFEQGSDGNTWTGNSAQHNNLTGFGCALSSFTTYAGDVSISNDRQGSGGANAGFVFNNCAFTSVSAPVTLDPTTSPTQVNGVLNSASFNTSIVGCPTGSTVALSDASASVGTFFNNCGKPLGTSLNLSTQTANVSATTLYTTLSSSFGWGGAGLYRVCASAWATVGGSGTLVLNAIAPSGAGTVTVPIGSSLNLGAVTNGGGGCALVHAAASSAIQVSTSGYSSGTFSLQATVEPAILQ